MRKHLPDLLFILVAGGIMLLINEFGLEHLLARYAFLLLLVAYFIGRVVGRKWNKE